MRYLILILAISLMSCNKETIVLNQDNHATVTIKTETYGIETTYTNYGEPYTSYVNLKNVSYLTDYNNLTVFVKSKGEIKLTLSYKNKVIIDTVGNNELLIYN